MKLMLLLGAVFLTGRVSMPTLEQLEEQAFLTGDWSAVEQREKLIAKRDSRRGMKCPTYMVAYCEQRLGQKRCACVSKSEITALMSWR